VNEPTGTVFTIFTVLEESGSSLLSHLSDCFVGVSLRK